MIEEAFEVATEFRFDVGEAVLGTNTLRSSVEALSGSADNALNKLNYLAGGLVAHLGFGSGGLLTILTRAVELNEEFNVGTMGFINSISSNMGVLSGHVHGFNEQMETSKQLMGDVGRVAGKLGLSTPQLAQTTLLLSSPLAQRGKLGNNYGQGIELAKNAMIAGEATGLGNQAVSEALLRGLSPGGSVMGKLFERMVNTAAFHNARVIHPAQLANMDLNKKTDLIIKAMSELGNNAGYLEARLNSLTVRFRIMKAAVENTLGPIGDAIRKPLIKVFEMFTDFLNKNGPMIGKAIGDALNSLLEDPKKFLIGLMQLRKVGEDFHGALKFAEIFSIFRLVKWVAGMMGFTFNGGMIRLAFSYLMTGISWLIGIIPWLKVLQVGFNILRTTLVDFVAPFMAAFLVLQGLSKAHAMAQVSDVSDIAAMTPQLAAAVGRWKTLLGQIWLPFQTIIDLIANNTTWIFKWSLWAKIFVGATEIMEPALADIGRGFVQLAADIKGFSAMMKGEWMWILDIGKNTMDAVSAGDKEAFKRLINGPDAAGNFLKAREDFIKKADQMKFGETVVQQTVYNTNHVAASFNMREQLEPDRVAFAVTEHLKKLVISATQPRGGQSLQHGFAAGNFAGTHP